MRCFFLLGLKNQLPNNWKNWTCKRNIMCLEWVWIANWWMNSMNNFFNMVENLQFDWNLISLNANWVLLGDIVLLSSSCFGAEIEIFVLLRESWSECKTVTWREMWKMLFTWAAKWMLKIFFSLFAVRFTA